MSTDYVMPNVSREAVLAAIEQDDDIIVTDDGDSYTIKMPIDKNYSLNKRVRFAQMVNVPPDTIQQGGNTATIFLAKAPDEIHSWFWGTGTSIHHPEVILNRIVELVGRGAYWVPEHDDEYFEYI